jgi:hypothetical protein
MDARQRRQDHVGGDPAVSASLGADDVQPGPPVEAARAEWRSAAPVALPAAEEFLAVVAAEEEGERSRSARSASGP